MKTQLGPAIEQYNDLIETIENEDCGDIRAALVAISDRIRAEIMVADVRLGNKQDTLRVFARIDKLFKEVNNKLTNIE